MDASVEREKVTGRVAVGLFWIAAITAHFAAGWALVEETRFLVSPESKLPLSGLKVAVLRYNGVIATCLTIATIACAYATFSRARRRNPLAWNGLLLAFALLWLAISIVALNPSICSLRIGKGSG